MKWQLFLLTCLYCSTNAGVQHKSLSESNKHQSPFSKRNMGFEDVPEETRRSANLTQSGGLPEDGPDHESTTGVNIASGGPLTSTTDVPLKNLSSHKAYGIGSVRQYPSEIHLCNAVFIRTSVMLTTATCIVGVIPEEIRVHVLSRNLVEGGVIVLVRDLVLHSNFEISPLRDNFGLIFLRYPVKDAYVFQLPTEHVVHLGTPVTVFGWKYIEMKKQFLMKEQHANVISNAKCSWILKGYAECYMICAGAPMIDLSSYDESVPLTVHGKGHDIVLGLYSTMDTTPKLTAKKFSKVLPYVSWILGSIKNETNYTF